MKLSYATPKLVIGGMAQVRALKALDSNTNPTALGATGGTSSSIETANTQ